MHDVFHQNDLTNDTQHYALSHWADIARRNPAVPLADMMACRRLMAMVDYSILFNLDAGSIRDARVERVGAGVRASLSFDPTGSTLSQLMPPDYVADVIPAYAFCAGSFRPLSSLDEVTHVNGAVALVRRLVLPLEQQPPGRTFAARYLLMIYDKTAGEADPAAEPGPCVGPVRSNRALSVAVFRDRRD